MKMISKIAKVAFGLVLMGSAVFGQSLDDAKKAIDAEQYQKAKGMLKNLTVTQPTKDENFFYLGWVYVIQDYADSAKTTFTKGLAADPKSALNYVGLGAVALASNDDAGATSNFNMAISNTGKKDSQPYLYIGKAYLLDAKDGKFSPAKANAAIDALNKGKAANPKDAAILVTLGNAYRTQLKSNEAYENYQAALALDPKMPAASVAAGVLSKYADNFEDANKQFQAALANDPNYGPAYREIAETDLREAQANMKVASVKVKEGVENYKKYLSLTDESAESLFRYADFLVNAGDYTALQEVATKLSKSATVNARIYRYLAYAAYENKDYAAGLTAINTWFSKATPNRLLPRDYSYLGRLQIASGQDTVKGIESLKKYAEMDTTQVQDAYSDIVNVYKKRKDYKNIAVTYNEITDKVHKPLLTEHVYEGIYYYYAFSSKNPDSTLLVKSDTAMNYVIRMAVKPVAEAYSTKARVADIRDNSDLSKMQGYAKPWYEKYIEIFGPQLSSLSTSQKNALAESHAYLGNYYFYHDKDATKAEDEFNKAKEIDPNNRQAKFYFDNKAGAPAAAAGGSKPAAPKK
jgi:tetratricopeptide (TPR) repeat protein